MNAASVDRGKQRSIIQEKLVDLYLRLNGFFTTGHIVHSSHHGNNLTEIDVLALRMPHNADTEREVGTHELLDLECGKTDLLICEVKSRGQPVHFNDALTRDIEAVAKLLRWAGPYYLDEVPDQAALLHHALALPLPPDAPPTVNGPRNVRVRCVLFFPETHRRRANHPWFICGDEIMSYVHRCLYSEEERPLCSTAYDPSLWADLEQLTRYFKTRNSPGNMGDLYRAFGI